MYSFYILLSIIVVAAIAGLLEYAMHQKRVNSIPLRIHINGTRGKSSVTRLVGAGLRQGGISNITKVTGTFPRLILEDGTETFIHRKSSANIIEQLSIVKFASSRKVKALVMECMALQPQYQTITEKHMIRSNISVMTNVRIDHTDVMGHTIQEIAETMGRTIPRNELLFTSENVYPELLKKIADRRNTSFRYADPSGVSKDDMKGFKYIEHRENVALALEICKHLKVDKQTALKGMYEATPDAGVLTKSEVVVFNKKMVFYNAFAANDPDSTLLVWNKIRDEIGFEGSRIILLNTRQDRLYRARQLAEMVAGKISNEIDYLVLIGQSTDVVEGMAVDLGLPRKKIVSIGWTTPDKVYEKILAITDKVSTTVGIGNMGGMGAGTVEYFENRSL
ncbi:MAG: poly-gamma-glutamate synthase PgsB [Bacteroidales bacterium]|nr:poly-gamma-glutamate synthase PgsB [Bacteroidales bacterium]